MIKAIAFIGLIAFCCACKKSDSPGPVTPPVTPPVKPLGIAAINPTSGPDSTLVTITGGGFGTVAAQDSVYFNGHGSLIETVNDSVLTVRVPIRAGTGPVIVKTGGKAVTGPAFTYQFSTSEVLFAGNGNISTVDGQGKSASFSYPTGLALMPNGTLFVAESGSGAIRMVTPDAWVSTYPVYFYAGINVSGGNMQLHNYQLMGLALDTSDNQLWIGDGAWSEVASFSALGDPVSLRLVVGVSGPETIYNLDLFNYTTGVAAANGEVWVADYGGNGIQLINPAKSMQVYHDSNSLYNGPAALALDGQQNLYIANTLGNNILKKTNGGAVSVFAGSGSQGTADGIGTAASFWGPQGIAVDSSGNVYVADSYNQRVRIITPAGQVSSLSYQISYPAGLAVDAGGTTLYVADGVSMVIYKISIY